jgi:hypothetical protein
MSEEISFEDELMRLLDITPFQPFSLVLTSGDRYEMTERHDVAIKKNSNTVVVLHPKTGLSFLRKNQIVAVDAPSPV